MVRLFFYQTHDGLPKQWIARMKDSMQTICPMFNTHRMLEEYLQEFYVKGADIGRRLTKDNCKNARKLAKWKQQIISRWDHIKINLIEFENHQDIPVGDKVPVNLDIELGDIHPEEIRIDLYYGPVDARQEFIATQIAAMQFEGSDEWGNYRFTGEITAESSGANGFLVRILPQNELQLDPYETGKIIWL